MTTYEFKMEKLSEDMGICTRYIEDCYGPMFKVCTPGADEKHLFLVGETDVEVSYDANKQPTIIIGGSKVFKPDEYLDDENDATSWVLETLGSSAIMLLTGHSLTESAKEFAYEIREELNSSLISAKTLVENSAGTDQFFTVIRDEFQDMSWNIQELVRDLDVMLIETLVDAGIPSGTVADSLKSTYTFDELCQMVQEFNEVGKYECQLFLTEVIRTIPQEELDKRWEL